MKRKDLTVEFKRAAVALMVPGVKISALARELGVNRQQLYEWREAMAAGDELLRRRGRPKRTVMPPAQANDLAGAQQRVAQLERRLGQQELELDFFKEALRRVEGLRRPSNGPAQLRLRPHPSDDAAARLTDGGTDVRIGAGQPGRILPALADCGPTQRGDGAARRGATAGAGAAPLRLSAHCSAAAACWLAGQPQAGLAADA